MSYRVVISRSADREMKRLPIDIQVRMERAMIGLEQQPRPSGCKKLYGSDDLWRIRIGVYRVLYLIDDGVRLVRVERAGHRSDVYR